MEQSSSEKQIRIRKQFDSFCKTILKNEMIDYERARSYRLKHEVSFSELTEGELEQLKTDDEYIVESEMFRVLDYDIEVKDELIGEAINDAISRDEDGLIDKDLESYIRSQSKILFRIFDVIVKDSKEKLCFDNTGKYYFNDKNIEFVSDLLDCYEEKNPNCKALLKGRFEDVEDDFCKEFLYEGFLDLARNEFNSLKIEEIDEIWRKLFNPDYREILKLVEDLKTDVEFYVGDIVPEEKNIEVFRKIKDIIRECNDQIVAISKETIEDFFPISID